jgi:hypothetical protein
MTAHGSIGKENGKTVGKDPMAVNEGVAAGLGKKVGKSAAGAIGEK